MSDFLLFVAVGFAAQLIDGAIGMAYGLASTAVLLGLGFPPVTASASVHAAEVFTTGASALSHWRFGNVRWNMVARLASLVRLAAFVAPWSFPSLTATR